MLLQGHGPIQPYENTHSHLGRSWGRTVYMAPFQFCCIERNTSHVRGRDKDGIDIDLEHLIDQSKVPVPWHIDESQAWASFIGNLRKELDTVSEKRM